MTASFSVLWTLVLVLGDLISADFLLEIEWIIQNFDKGVGIVTVKFILARLPASIFGDSRTALRVVEKKIGRTAEILLAMRIVALAPIVDD